MTTESNESTIPAAESGDAFDHFCTVTEGFMCCGAPGMTTSGNIDLTREKEEDKDALDKTFETIGRGCSRDTTTDANDEMIETKEEAPASQKSESQDKVTEGQQQEEEDLVDQVFNHVEGACCNPPHFESQDKVTKGQQEEEELLDQVFNNVEGVCCNQPQKDEDEPILLKETEPSKAAEVEVTKNDSKLSTGSKETDTGTGDEPLIKEQTIVTRPKWWQLLCCKTAVVETVVVM